jgi:hypothetical protein
MPERPRYKLIQVDLPLELDRAIVESCEDPNIPRDYLLRTILKIGFIADALDSQPGMKYAFGFPGSDPSKGLSDTNRITNITSKRNLVPIAPGAFARHTIRLREEVVEKLEEVSMKRETTPETLFVEFVRLALEPH